MPDTIQSLQAEYDRLEKEGAEKYGQKTSLLLEKQIRDRLKEELKQHGLDRDAHKLRKGEAFKRLHAAKEGRRKEIVAAVVAGTTPEADGEAEIVSLGWELNVARADFADARRAASTSPPEPQRIVDPIAGEPVVAREVKYTDPGQLRVRPARRK